MADAIVFVYDSSDTNSFSYISNLRQQYPLLHQLPSLFVATKSDLDLVQQRHEVQPEVYCSKLGLRIPSSFVDGSGSAGVGLGAAAVGSFGANNTAGPIHVSVKLNELADIFGIICDIAQDPRGAVPGGAQREGALMRLMRRRWVLFVGVTLLGAGTAIAFVGLRGPYGAGGSGGFARIFSPTKEGENGKYSLTALMNRLAKRTSSITQGSTGSSPASGASSSSWQQSGASIAGHDANSGGWISWIWRS